MKPLIALSLSLLSLTACSKAADTNPYNVDPTWYPSPSNRLQLVVPSKYGPSQDSVAVIFRNPDAVKTRYQFQLRRYTGPTYVEIADDQTRLLKAGETQQINYSTVPTGQYVYGKDAIHVLLTNSDTHEFYGDFQLTN
ncbi:hypothetical protein [Hymenobacter coccineus]|uniref:Uncharacterized protein n=1 Tax=Hymenobacter coccineus TaxID=1908235 RepID=A0A1G1TKP9_9BACT|nr:hypothetical protein [Hymenobacter coccineus]OGX91438.1 hypothetical protein BEN49_19735 [Hymenobacter coccineus]